MKKRDLLTDTTQVAESGRISYPWSAVYEITRLNPETIAYLNVRPVPFRASGIERRRPHGQQQVSNLFLVFLSARFSPGGTDCDNDVSIAHPQY